MSYNPNYLQGSAMAALTWVVYDVCISLDREIVSVWRFFLMESIGTEHFMLPLVVSFNGQPPPPALYSEPPITSSLQYAKASRWYIGLTEVLSILAGELLILIRINTVYGWSRKIVALTLFLFSAETAIGLVTTVISLLGGSKGLFGSRNILICGPDGANVPDVNIAMWYASSDISMASNETDLTACRLTSIAVACVYIGLVIYKALDVLQDIEAADGRPGAHKVGLVAYFRSSRITLPILHRCLRDAGTIVFCGRIRYGGLFVVSHDRFAQSGSAWLLATYSVASTRIFLNLKELTLPANNYNGVTWSQFQQNSVLELQLRSALRTRTSQDRRTVHETPPARVPEAVCPEKETIPISLMSKLSSELDEFIETLPPPLPTPGPPLLMQSLERAREAAYNIPITVPPLPVTVPHFHNAEVRRLCRTFGAKPHVVAKYSPWVNGLVEGNNRILQAILKTLCAPDLGEEGWKKIETWEDLPVNWPDHFDNTIFILNNRILRALDHTPNEMFFGMVINTTETGVEEVSTGITMNDIEVQQVHADQQPNPYSGTLMKRCTCVQQ
ncbi:hypothetical protein B0H13DRAFT_2370659 [Mycena leptocephala]|nr:hypothetical protein B0H13DRAFT_2370659 [Mycena leptocephala]